MSSLSSAAASRPPSVIIYYVRHGERLDELPGNRFYEENPDRWFDTPLTDRGRIQANRAGELLRQTLLAQYPNHPIHPIIYASPLTRTIETALEFHDALTMKESKTQSVTIQSSTSSSTSTTDTPYDIHLVPAIAACAAAFRKHIPLIRSAFPTAETIAQFPSVEHRPRLRAVTERIRWRHSKAHCEPINHQSIGMHNTTPFDPSHDYSFQGAHFLHAVSEICRHSIAAAREKSAAVSSSSSASSAADPNHPIILFFVGHREGLRDLSSAPNCTGQRIHKIPYCGIGLFHYYLDPSDHQNESFHSFGLVNPNHEREVNWYIEEQLKLNEKDSENTGTGTGDHSMENPKSSMADYISRAFSYVAARIKSKKPS